MNFLKNRQSLYVYFRRKDLVMLRAAIAFFVLALVAYFLGANGIAGFSVEAGKLLLYVFIVLAVISFVINLLKGRSSKT